MIVQDLNRQQIDELKESYVVQLKQNGISWGELSEAYEIPDEIIFEHYDGIVFTPDDFFCGGD